MESVMEEVARLIRQRNRTLSLAAASFVIWQGGQLADEIIRAHGWGGEPQDLAVVLSILLGAVGWAIASVLFLVYASRVGRTKTQAIIQDELFCHHQRIAFRTGYLALIASISVFLALDLLVEFSATTAIRSLLIIGVSVPLITFVLINRDGGDEA
jgi:hypothetical protein